MSTTCHLGSSGSLGLLGSLGYLSLLSYESQWIKLLSKWVNELLSAAVLNVLNYEL